MNARQLKESALNSRHISISQTKQSIHLRLVPDYSKPLNKWKGAIIVISLMLIVSAVLGVLLNTMLARNQYEITSLVAKERALRQETESLQSMVAYYQSPQVLQSKAAKLGLVEAGSRGIINMSTGEIKEPESTSTYEKHHYDTHIPLPTKPELFKPKSDGDKREKSTSPVTPDTIKKATQSNSQQPRPTVTETKREAGKKVVILDGNRPAEWNDERLNGGTIPAPKLKEPK